MFSKQVNRMIVVIVVAGRRGHGKYEQDDRFGMENELRRVTDC